MSYKNNVRLFVLPRTFEEPPGGARMLWVTRHFTNLPSGRIGGTGEFKYAEPFSWADGRKGTLGAKTHFWVPGHRQTVVDGVTYLDAVAPQPRPEQVDRDRIVQQNG
jgi:hypothetical protein